MWRCTTSSSPASIQPGAGAVAAARRPRPSRRTSASGTAPSSAEIANSVRNPSRRTIHSPKSGATAVATKPETPKMPSAQPRCVAGTRSTTNENIATKYTEKPTPCSARTSAKTPMESKNSGSKEAMSTSVVPAIMNARRPSASTHGPTSGWHTMPTALNTPMTMPIAISVPPSAWMCRGSRT